jgi:hypothetical protein
MAGVGPLMFLIVVFGVIPGPLFDQIRPAVAVITEAGQTQRLNVAKKSRTTPQVLPTTKRRAAANSNRPVIANSQRSPT